MKQSTIEALRYMRGLSGTGVLNAIRDTCKKEELNEEFINEFHEFITPEMFSTSHDLSLEMISKYPTLFSLEAWKAYPSRSLLPLMSADIRKSFTSSEIVNFIMQADPESISEEIFNELFAIEDDSLRSVLLWLYPKTLNNEFIIANAKSLSSRFFSGSKRSANLANPDLESILTTSPRTMEFITAVLLSVKNNDIAWQSRMLDDVGTRINVIEMGGTFDKILIRALQSFHPDIIDKYILLVNQYSPNALSHIVLKHILQYVELQEDTVSALIPKFRANMLANALAAYAAENGYSSVVLQLAI